MNIQGWFLLGLTGLVSLLSKGLSRIFSSTTTGRHQFFWRSALFMIWLSHPYMTTRKTIALTIWPFVGNGTSLLFVTLSRFLIAFLPRSKHTLILWLQSPSTVVLEPKKINLSLFPLFPFLFAMKWWDWMPWSLFFECWVLSQPSHSLLSLSSWSSLVSLHFLPLEWYNLHNWGWWYFSQQS